MTKLPILYILFCILSVPISHGQEFQKAFTDFNVGNDITRDQEGNLYLGGYTTFAYDANVDKIISLDILNKLDAEGNVLWSKDFEVENTFTEILRVMALENGNVILLCSIDENDENIQLGLASISPEGNIQWSKRIETVIPNFDRFNSEVNLIPAVGNSFYVQSKKTNETQQTHLLSKYTTAGSVQWTKSYTLDLKINVSTILPVGENELALLGYYTTDTNTTEGMLVILDETGGVLNSAAYANLQLLSIIAHGDQYILKAKDAISKNFSLLKVDATLDFVWAKEFDFQIEGQIQNMQKFGDNEFAVYAYDDRSRKEVLAYYDVEGNPLWSKLIESKYSGRPFYEKVINAGDKILLMSHIWTTDLKSSILRQIPLDGNTLECVLPSFCQTSAERIVEKNELVLMTADPISTELPLTIRLRNATKSSTAFCREPDGVPSPVFELDESACLSDPIFITELENQGADDVFWSIAGGPDDAILPLANFSEGVPIILQDSGLYTITQFVTYKGCTESFDQEVKITIPLPFNFAKDSLILCQDEIETVNAGRPGFVSYLWKDDQSTDALKKIDQAGTYTVALYDGNCTKDYDLVVEDFDYSNVAFSLGPDTTVCEFRRFTLSADVENSSVEYKWSDGPNTPTRLANKAGSYTLTAFLDGCDYEDEIFVTFEPCNAQVYMPNIFSPNADGINDLLFPQGPNFELLSFRVYNRWGALLHDELTPWDGEYANGKRITGTYIYNLTFVNFRSGEVESLRGDVVLTR